MMYRTKGSYLPSFSSLFKVLVVCWLVLF